jgi:uncharacterized BrkB/YihY/UPF0761 family membrane protein
MIRRFLWAIVMFPAFAVLVALAVANHQQVTVSFDPFDSSDADLAVTVPLYLAGFTVFIAGVVLGGFAAWLAQRKQRRIRSRLAGEVAAIQTELAHLKRQMARPEGRSAARPIGSASKTLPAA